MRKPLLAAWALLPIGAWAYHEGPGQDRMALDRADDYLADAHRATTDGDWAAAVTAYEAALAELPDGHEVDAQRIRLARAKAQMQVSQLPQARADLEILVADLADTDDAALLADARAALANAQYYMTWLMRLEGVERTRWEAEIEASRQTYRLLAEQAEARGDDAKATEHREDLESSIRLARLELEELQGLPLPSQ